jgi:hypothetical protein
MPDMDTLISVAGLALALLVSIGIGAAIGALAGTEDAPTTLASIFAPIVTMAPTGTAPTRPVVREEEPVRWRFDPIEHANPAAA